MLYVILFPMIDLASEFSKPSCLAGLGLSPSQLLCGVVKQNALVWSRHVARACVA